MTTPMILLSKSDENYLQKCATDLGFAYGLIIGQLAEPNKYIVAHLAKNVDEDVEVPEANDNTAAPPLAATNIAEIDALPLANQWISAHRMIPGSFEILGIFAAGTSADITEEQAFKHAKKVLSDVNSVLTNSRNAFQVSEDDLGHSSNIFLCYSSTTKKVVCKSYNKLSNGGAFTVMDCRFVEKPLEWYLVESNFQLNDTFGILDVASRVNIEQQYKKTFDEVKQCFRNCEIFIQNEFVPGDLLLDAYIKRKNEYAIDVETELKPNEPIQASILSRLTRTRKEIGMEPLKGQNLDGTMRCLGLVSSRVWCNPKNSIATIKHFIRTDLLRSLSTRLQMYCDALTEPNITGDGLFIGEPPRRIYFTLPTSHNVPTCPIQFSEYIFRGEAPTVAVAQAKQILDLDIEPTQIVDDLESLPATDAFTKSQIDDPSITPRIRSNPLGVTQSPSSDVVQKLALAGTALTIAVVVIAIFVHFFMK